MNAQSQVNGRFGHHPDHAIDFCIEVEELLSEIENHRIGFTNDMPSKQDILDRVDLALQFNPKIDEKARLAKERLIHISRLAYWMSDNIIASNVNERCAADLGQPNDMARALNLFGWLSANPWLELSARINDYGELEWVVYRVDYHEDKFYEWTELSCAEWPMDALEIAMHKTITKSNES